MAMGTPCQELSGKFNDVVSGCYRGTNMSGVTFEKFRDLQHSFRAIVISEKIPVRAISRVVKRGSVVRSGPCVARSARRVSFITVSFSSIPVADKFCFKRAKRARDAKSLRKNTKT